MCGGSVILSGNNIALLVESAGDNSTFFIFVMPSATSFFCAPKKMKQKKGAPAGGLHSANRFYGNTTCCGLHSWDTIRMSTANRTRTLCVMALSNFVL